MSKLREMMDQAYPWVDVWTPDGWKQYQFTLLKTRQAAKIYHESVTSLLSVIAGAIGSKEDARGRIEAIRSLDFDLIWNLGEALLRGCNVREDKCNPQNMISIRELESTNYFDDKREELYCAIWGALRANYPNSWSRLERGLEGFGPKIEAAIRTKLSILSEPEPQGSSQSPSGGE